MALQPGEIIDGKYRIVRLIGEGGMGAVYEGENTRIRRKVAIKVLHSSVAEKTDVVARFEREAQAAGRIGSEHIVEVLDLGSLPSGERYMVMEFLEGEDLTTRIKKRRRLRPQDSIPILHQVLEGLAAAHQAGIVHRDLKPDNVFLLHQKAGRADFVKILDFGVSKFSSVDAEMGVTRAGSVMGTPYYMAPEQAKGGEIDARTDLYAVGVVLYQMTTGRVPFNAGSFNELLFKIALETPEPIEKLVPEIPASFAAIVNKAMAREPTARYQSSRQFQEALAQWQLTAPPIDSLPSQGEMAGVMPMMHTPSGALLAAPGSIPGFSATGSGSFPQLDPRLSSPQLAQTPVPGMLTPANAALAVTQTKPKSRGTLIALVGVGLGILAAGAVGVYLYITPAPAAAAPGEPTAEPTTDATAEPTAEPTADATAEPTAEPTTDATAEPTAEPTADPTAEATAEPTAVAPRPTAPYRPPTKPTPTPKETAAPAATSTPTAAPTQPGRQINTEL